MSTRLQLLFQTILLPLCLGACQGTGGSAMQNDIEDYLYQAAVLDYLDMDISGVAKSVPRMALDDWKYVDDQHLLITLDVEDHLLLTLTRPCSGLQTALGVGFQARSSMLNGGDYLVAGFVGGRRKICQIEALYYLQPRDNVAQWEYLY